MRELHPIRISSQHQATGDEKNATLVGLEQKPMEYRCRFCGFSFCIEGQTVLDKEGKGGYEIGGAVTDASNVTGTTEVKDYTVTSGCPLCGSLNWR